MTLSEIKVVVDAQPVPCLLIDILQPHNVMFANKAFLNAFNVASKTLTGVAHNELTAQYFEHSAQNAMRLAVETAGKTKLPYTEKLLVALSNNSSMMAVDTYPVYNADGDVLCLAQNFNHYGTEVKDTDNPWRKSFDLFNYSPLPTWAYDTVTLKFLAANQAAQNTFGYTLDEYLNLTIMDMWYGEDADALQQALDEKVREGLPNNQLIRLITRDGRALYTEISSAPLPSWGPNTRIAMANDVTEQIRSAQNAELSNNLERLEKRILELNSQPDTPILEVLNSYTKGIENIFPEMICSVMQVHDDKIYNWATSSLPADYINSIEGTAIAENTGSCGTCAFLKQPVIAGDIATDARWIDYRECALANNLLACWSYPIMDSANEVVATFGLYYSQVRLPEKHEIKIIERAAALLKVIIENRRYAATLKETMQLMTLGQELASFGNWAWDIANNKVTWSDTLYQIYGLDKAGFKATFEGYQELLHPDDRERVYNIISGVLTNKQDVTFEERIIRPNGEVRYLRSWGTLKYDSNGTPLKMIGACLDITESKLVQQDLEALNSRYSDLFQLSPHPMFVYDINTLSYLDVNDAAIEIYGYSKEEFRAMTLYEIRPQEDIPLFKKILNDDIKEGVQHTGLSRHVKRNGEIITVMTRGNSINYDGKAARIAIAIDYTDKLKAEDALKASERRFRALIQEGSDLICITDTEGRCKYVSPNAAFVAGIDADELMGKKIGDYMSAPDAALLADKLAKITEHKRVELPPLTFNNADGETRWLQTVITDLREDTAIDGIVLNSRDVTQRVQQDIVIKEHLERFNSVSKATSDAIWDLNILSGEITWNHGINGIFGHKALKNDYQWWYSHVHPEDIDNVTSIVNRTIINRFSRWTSEYRFQCADGSYKSVLDRGFLVFDDDGCPVRMIGAIQDITERVNYIHAIEKHNAMLQEIAWTQSHVVRAPLARILGLLDLLNSGHCDADSKLMLQYLNISAKELDEVIHKIITKSQPQPTEINPN
ncbi:PAS domain S-box protein [Mucilaginibacter sp. UR6-1]|uniref:PAS domain S-box protein n=1 Tax=Mucilaginibacter sp. UR6-1 TaxID=1435643 RepID=UPI001E2F0633|nr:PAS domain S-box protein [Mucilaginibacter sp. UR6-1]MCC8410119.1 PAS domain S-box protein [Mucilaginibacter sp. UR6-1]